MDKLYFDIWTCALYTIWGILCFLLIDRFMRSTERIGLKKRREWKKRSRYYTICFFLILLILAVFRKVSSTLGGTDVPNYINNFLTIFNGGIDRGGNTELEWGFQFLTKIVRFFTSEYKIYFMFMYGIIIYGYIKFIKTRCPQGLVYIPFILVMYPFLKSFNTLRTSVAIAFILIGLSYIDKNKWKSLLLIASSVLIHRISFLFVIVWPFYMIISKLNLRMSKRQFVLISTIGVTLIFLAALQLQQYVIIFRLLEGNDASYIEATLGQDFLMRYPMFFGQLLLFFFISMYYNTIKWDDQTCLLRLLFIFDLWMAPAGLVLGIWRSVEYLYLVRLSLWSVIIYTITKNSNNTAKFFVKTVFFVIFAAWLVFRIYKEWEPVGISPYVFEIFTDSKSLNHLY